MGGRNIKSRKRAPRLPGHLLGNDSFTTSPGSPEHASERPCSPTSSIETSSVLDLDDRLSDVSHMGGRSGFIRLTQSPLMHSAIVQGAAPKARVKNTAIGPLMPTIKSVLGFGGLAAVKQQQDSNLRSSRSQTFSSETRANGASVSIRNGSQDSRTGSKVMTVPSAQQRGPLFAKGDLVWFHHPSGPWISGRLTSVLQSCCEPLYVITTDGDGVKRHARKEDVQIRVSATPPRPSGRPAERVCSVCAATSVNSHRVNPTARRSHCNSRRSNGQELTHTILPDGHKAILHHPPPPEAQVDEPAAHVAGCAGAERESVIKSADNGEGTQPPADKEKQQAVGVGLSIVDLHLH